MAVIGATGARSTTAPQKLDISVFSLRLRRDQRRFFPRADDALHETRRQLMPGFDGKTCTWSQHGLSRPAHGMRTSARSCARAVNVWPSCADAYLLHETPRGHRHWTYHGRTPVGCMQPCRNPGHPEASLLRADDRGRARHGHGPRLQGVH
ncbi:hypothetical protein DAEQUDRAFT_319006 [Daedalea quercina L-15889]|uniref:Uncharacterized protein n=1 Tax=Daedalea quercina L-15889 TaxID=1314783 RepID=A0A165PXF4_9APHY|nr:hypothetical protein DAEQUDRAFT_319006 [Daedalea quercina L-15889]